MEKFISDSAEQTIAIGKKLAEKLSSGDCILYRGEMEQARPTLQREWPIISAAVTW